MIFTDDIGLKKKVRSIVTIQFDGMFIMIIITKRKIMIMITITVVRIIVTKPTIRTDLGCSLI